jgi:hypothetical protein
VSTNRSEQIASRWTAALSTVPSVFGRLVILSSLRDRNTGWYVHHGLEVELGENPHNFLLRSHEEIFLDWQFKTMDQQIRDLKAHLRTVAQSAEGFGQEQNQRAKISHVLNIWTVTQPYCDFAPLSVSALERDTFIENLTTLVALLRSQTIKERPAGSMGGSGSF